MLFRSVTRNNLIRVNNYVFDYMESIKPGRASLANVYNGNIAVTALYSDTKFYEGVFSYAFPQSPEPGLYYIGGTLCYLFNGYAWALE